MARPMRRPAPKLASRGSTPRSRPTWAAKADTLFKGETLRSILLNAYGWWTIATIALWAGYFMVAAGIVLLALAILGFRHAKRAATMVPDAVRVVTPERELAGLSV